MVVFYEFCPAVRNLYGKERWHGTGQTSLVVEGYNAIFTALLVPFYVSDFMRCQLHVFQYSKSASHLSVDKAQSTVGLQLSVSISNDGLSWRKV